MITDREIYRSAAIMIREHGEDAALEVGMKVDCFLEQANVGGHLLWKRILVAVLEMQQVELAAGERRH